MFRDSSIFRTVSIAWLAFALLMLASTLVGFAHNSNTAGVLGVGGLLATLVFPVSLIPCVIVFRFARQQPWLLVVLTLGAAGVGALGAALLAMGLRNIVAKSILAWRLESSWEVNYLVWPGLNSGLGHALLLLCYATFLSAVTWLAFEVRARRIPFWLCASAGCFFALCMVAAFLDPVR